MIPFAYAPIILDAYRRQLQSLGIEPVDARIAERRTQRRDFRQMLDRIGRWLARRPAELLQRDPVARAGAATARA